MLFPGFINRRFWRPTAFFRQPDEYGGVSSFPGEHWFFINGIGTNADVDNLIGSHTKVYDVEGGFVMPGIIDPHIHPGLLMAKPLILWIISPFWMPSLL